jgi:hypothetical protein
MLVSFVDSIQNGLTASIVSFVEEKLEHVINSSVRHYGILDVDDR